MDELMPSDGAPESILSRFSLLDGRCSTIEVGLTLSFFRKESINFPSALTGERGVPFLQAPNGTLWLGKDGLGSVRKLSSSRFEGKGRLAVTAAAALHPGE